MSEKKPRNIIMIVADSLRYDSVYEGGTKMPYVEQHSIQFSEARSGGCWTLPATASVFTGRMPHEHGATSQSRNIHQDIPTLAEKMKAAGYKTYQVTANIATTDIFGLHRGFDEVRRIWKMVDPKFNSLQQLLVMMGKPRLRKKLFSKDALMDRMSGDLENAKTWLQYTFADIFEESRKIMRENEAKGESSFIFLNLMETHFPYHIAPTFRLSQRGIIKKIKESITLFHMANQTFLKKGEQNIKAKQLAVLKGRQRLAWESLAPHVDEFVKEMHEGMENLVVLGADHGENFGESGWTYHFSNITDAGNKVPLFWLSNKEGTAKTITEPVSSRHLYHSLLKVIGEKTEGPCIITEPDRSIPIMQSFWYNNRNKTHQKYKYNQLCLLVGDYRFLWRNGQWFKAPFRSANYDEPNYIMMEQDTHPIHDLDIDAERKAFYLQTLENFSRFSSGISFEAKGH